MRNHSGKEVALENVPALVLRDQYEKTTGRKVAWPHDRYWGFGGTPQDMKRVLEALGRDWRCLLDFTHLIITHNQAKADASLSLAPYKKLERLVRGYLDLRHWSICHFSGIPPQNFLTDTHDFLDAKPMREIREAIREMDIVCLEIPWDPITAQRSVEGFRKQYLK